MLFSCILDLALEEVIFYALANNIKNCQDFRKVMTGWYYNAMVLFFTILQEARNEKFKEYLPCLQHWPKLQMRTVPAAILAARLVKVWHGLVLPSHLCTYITIPTSLTAISIVHAWYFTLNF